jgi:hypothetical protein
MEHKINKEEPRDKFTYSMKLTHRMYPLNTTAPFLHEETNTKDWTEVLKFTRH